MSIQRWNAKELGPSSRRLHFLNSVDPLPRDLQSLGAYPNQVLQPACYSQGMYIPEHTGDHALRKKKQVSRSISDHEKLPSRNSLWSGGWTMNIHRWVNNWRPPLSRINPILSWYFADKILRASEITRINHQWTVRSHECARINLSSAWTN